MITCPSTSSLLVSVCISNGIADRHSKFTLTTLDFYDKVMHSNARSPTSGSLKLSIFLAPQWSNVAVGKISCHRALPSFVGGHIQSTWSSGRLHGQTSLCRSGEKTAHRQLRSLLTSNTNWVLWHSTFASLCYLPHSYVQCYLRPNWNGLLTLAWGIEGMSVTS